ncbi:MAG: PAS domain-containing protein [Sedimentisphaerales bacterium]|nr:PAS domain-containing protein [Sedimentisphaerales bacterium]
MNSKRSLYVIVTAFAAAAFFAAALAVWQKSGSEEGWWHAGIQGLGLVVPVCCVIGAVGVIWLGWSLFRLTGGIASIAAWLRHDKPELIQSNPNATVKSLVEAIKTAFDRYSSQAEDSAEQVKNSQIQAHVSQRRQKNTEAIIYSMRDAVVVIDEYNKLSMANEAAGKLFAFDYKHSHHTPISELIGTDYSEFVDFLIQSTKNKARATRREMEFLQTGRQKTFDCVVSCVFDQREELCGVAAVLHDITREKEVSQMKNDFVSHVSHELKTPLASITAYSEMLADGEADDEETRNEFYTVIQNQAKRLNRLIEDILNTSRIESGLIKVSKETASLTMLIEEQMQMIKSYAEEKGIEVIGQKPIVFDQVLVDKDMISQVIVNLLSNAVKYTPSGGTVTIKTDVDEIERLAKVTVTDTGVGIPEDEVEHVFEKFYRVKANNKQAKGTGLGLNLVKQIVEKVHDGRVFVTSKVNQGSTFGFELPLATAEAVQVA